MRTSICDCRTSHSRTMSINLPLWCSEKILEPDRKDLLPLSQAQHEWGQCLNACERCLMKAEVRACAGQLCSYTLNPENHFFKGPRSVHGGSEKFESYKVLKKKKICRKPKEIQRKKWVVRILQIHDLICLTIFNMQQKDSCLETNFFWSRYWLHSIKKEKNDTNRS